MLILYIIIGKPIRHSALCLITVGTLLSHTPSLAGDGLAALEEQAANLSDDLETSHQWKSYLTDALAEFNDPDYFVPDALATAAVSSVLLFEWIGRDLALIRAQQDRFKALQISGGGLMSQSALARFDAARASLAHFEEAKLAPAMAELKAIDKNAYRQWLKTLGGDFRTTLISDLRSANIKAGGDIMAIQEELLQEYRTIHRHLEPALKEMSIAAGREIKMTPPDNILRKLSGYEKKVMWHKRITTEIASAERTLANSLDEITRAQRLWRRSTRAGLFIFVSAATLTLTHFATKFVYKIQKRPVREGKQLAEARMQLDEQFHEQFIMSYESRIYTHFKNMWQRVEQSNELFTYTWPLADQNESHKLALSIIFNGLHATYHQKGESPFTVVTIDEKDYRNFTTDFNRDFFSRALAYVRSTPDGQQSDFYAAAVDDLTDVFVKAAEEYPLGKFDDDLLASQLKELAKEEAKAQ